MEKVKQLPRLEIKKRIKSFRINDQELMWLRRYQMKRKFETETQTIKAIIRKVAEQEGWVE